MPLSDCADTGALRDNGRCNRRRRVFSGECSVQYHWGATTTKEKRSAVRTDSVA